MRTKQHNELLTEGVFESFPILLRLLFYGEYSSLTGNYKAMRPINLELMSLMKVSDAVMLANSHTLNTFLLTVEDDCCVGVYVRVCSLSACACVFTEWVCVSVCAC